MNRQPISAAILGITASIAMAGTAQDILRTPETESETNVYRWTDADNALLDEVQRGCFNYFWDATEPPAHLAKDRLKSPLTSIAAVGFQLSALPIGVERGWITREQGEQRALTILDALIEHPNNRKYGVYLHFVDPRTGGLADTRYEILASTIDTGLLICGALPAGTYFGGEVAKRVDQMVREADWRKFLKESENVLSMGWAPTDRKSMSGSGEFHKARWWISSAEEHVIYWLAIGTPVDEHAVDPAIYYRLNRDIRAYDDMPPFVVSWSGTLFHYFFNQCWIDYRGLQADDPKVLGVDAPCVDWFENSRRAILTHRARCIAMRDKYTTLSENIWGLSAADGPTGYLVPHLAPSIEGKDKWEEGTVAPYAAGSSITMTPRESIAALHAMRNLKDKDGKPLIWHDPAKGGYGFVDSFNTQTGFVSDDAIGIDQGPMLLAIENARTGLIWRLFMEHPTSQRTVERLKLAPRSPR